MLVTLRFVLPSFALLVFPRQQDWSSAAIHVEDALAPDPGTAGLLLTGPFWFRESNQAHAWFGSSVTSAGDVNGDGYSDVLVGAQFFDAGDTNEGCAFVYHGSASGLAPDAAWMGEANSDVAWYGNSSATAGDVNGDGYSDVIVGAPFYELEGRAFVYHGSPSGLASTPAWVGDAAQEDAEFGTSVACAGDVNGDGFSDVIVGALRYDGGGAAFLYLGSASGLAPSPAWTAISSQGNADFGKSVASAGDVNGDGYDDVLVGVRNYDGGSIGEGRALLYLGSVVGLLSTPSWSVESNQVTADLGTSVACAGDVNGDGFADVIVGASRYDNGSADEGRAYVYHGSPGGLSTTAAWTAESDQSGAGFGGSVATAGDVNGDGYSDVVVGAQNFDDGRGVDIGRVWIYLGSSGGLATSAVWTTTLLTTQHLGNSVGTAGDVNGDGYSDVIAGSQNYGDGETNEGAAFVFHGGAKATDPTPAWIAPGVGSSRFGQSVATAGDVNGDGFSDVLVGAPLHDQEWVNEGRAHLYLGSAFGPTNAPTWTFRSDQDSANLGNSVASAGDVNGDGYSDVIIGAYHFTNGQQEEGRVYLFLGSSTGLATSPVWTAEGNQAFAWFGAQVASAGDVNGDGFSDVIIGASGAGEIADGRATVYLGSASGLSPHWFSSMGQSGSLYGASVACAGDVNGDGYSDVIVGAPGFDDPELDEGRVFVFLGSANGLTTIPWSVDSDASGARFGSCVATAGDVNGDGYSDVIVGAPDYSALDGSGGALVYLGSAAGLDANPAWITHLAQVGHFGVSAASAGDVDADGYSDVVVGAELYDNGALDEGLWVLYRGSASGLSSAALSVEGNSVHAQLGVSVATAGDVNGDGYSDVIVGADRDFDFGKARVHLGNGGRGWVHNPMQRRLDGDPLALFGLSDASSAFRLRATLAHQLTGFSWAMPGAETASLEWEVQPIGSGSSVSGSGSAALLPGVPLDFDEVVTGLVSQTPHRWRARFRTSNSLFPVTPWFSVPWNAHTEAKLRTPAHEHVPPRPRTRPPVHGGGFPAH